MDSVDALNDLSLSIQLEDQLKQLQNNFEENLPKEYKGHSGISSTDATKGKRG